MSASGDPLAPAAITANEIVDNSAVGFAIYSPDGRCEVANEAIAALVGATREAFLQQNFRRIASWKRTGLLEAAEVTLASGISRCLDVHTISTFGKEVWIECRFARIETAAGQRLFLIASDITDRKPLLSPEPDEPRTRSGIGRFLAHLIRPSGGYDRQARVQNRLVLALSLASLFAILAALFVLNHFYAPDEPFEHPVIVAGSLSAVAMLLTYLWARSDARRHRSAALFVVFNCILAPLSVAVVFDPNYFIGCLVGLVLGSALLRPRWIAAITITVVGIGVLLPTLSSTVEWQDALVVELVIMAMVGSVLAVLPWHYGLVEASRQGELARRNAELLHEIAARREAEASLRTHAHLQEVLVQETNHRVRNNLSAILGILSAERSRLRQGSTNSIGDVLSDLDRRIRGIAAAHDVLTAHDWQAVPVSDLSEAVLQMAASGAPPNQRVEIDVAPSTARVSARQTQHLALILAELAANSLKHANEDHLCIWVEFDASPDQLSVRYRDDGPGFATEILEGERTPGHLGLRLIDGIVSHSLQGRLLLSNDGGAVSTIEIPRDYEAQAA